MTNSENLLRVSGVMEMGYGIIPKKVMRDKRLTVEAKAIYAYLASFAGAGNTAFPSVELICAEIGVSNDRFYRHRKQLIALGYLSVEQIRGGRGKTGHNIYTLLTEQSEINPQDKEPQNREPQNKVPQNREPQDKEPQDKGSIINSPTINSSKKNSSDKKQKRKKEAIPNSIEDVEAYINEMGYGLNAQEFWDKNEMRGWKLNNGRPIEDWQACVRTFERNRKKWAKEKKDDSRQAAFVKSTDNSGDWGEEI